MVHSRVKIAFPSLLELPAREFGAFLEKAVADQEVASI
jgi:hypothetical protein